MYTTVAAMAEKQGVISEMELQLLMPSAEEQRAIICSLESDMDDESLHVYTVSQAWYDRWRTYVGLDQPSQQRQQEEERFGSGSSSEGTAVSYSKSEERVASTATAETDVRSAAPPPGPIEMDLTDDDNISVDEKVGFIDS